MAEERALGWTEIPGHVTQIGKAERAVAGKEPVKRNRFVKLTGGDKTINRELKTKARAVAGVKGQ